MSRFFVRVAPVGSRFGRHVVTSRSFTVGARSERYVECVCDCGRTSRRRAAALVSGVAMGCACSHTAGSRRLAESRIGESYGRLTVLAIDRSEKRIVAVCRCACGAEHRASANNVFALLSRSCGCLATESKSERQEDTVSRHPLHPTYLGMLLRCHDPKNHGFSRYGGRGIAVCDRWRESFAFFLADMGPRPSADHSIDRINNDGNYEPANCRWATQREQARNTRSNVWLEFNGERMLATDWADRLGLSRERIRQRIAMGYPIEKVLAPKQPSGGVRGKRAPYGCTVCRGAGHTKKTCPLSRGKAA